jgi:hypothetical protein
VPESFYEPDGGRYIATELTRGPWDPGAQHAGPPAALIGREIERLGGGRLGSGEGPPAQLARITFDLLRSVPIAPLTVQAEIARPGRSATRFRPCSSTVARPARRGSGGGGIRTPGPGEPGQQLSRLPQ